MDECFHCVVVLLSFMFDLLHSIAAGSVALILSLVALLGCVSLVFCLCWIGPVFGYQGCVLCCFLSGVLRLRFPCSPSTCHSVPPGWTSSWCMLRLNQLFNPCWDLINLIWFKTTDQQTNRHKICKLQEINIVKALKIMANGKNSSDEGFICCLCSLPAPGNRERLSHIIRILQCSLILTLHIWWLKKKP